MAHRGRGVVLMIAVGRRMHGHWYWHSFQLHFRLYTSRLLLRNCYNRSNQIASEFPQLFLYIAKNVYMTWSDISGRLLITTKERV
jgi:hypothetical protein